MNSPSSVKSYNNKSFWYWCRSLYQRMQSVFSVSLPSTWRGDIEDFFFWCLFKYGYVCISRNDKYGEFFQPCTISGIDFYYQPTKAIISNPAYSSELEIGTDCEILKLTPDFYGVFDIIEYYAERLSLLDNSINTGLVNSKFAFMYMAKNKAAGQALKKCLDKINSGEPAVIWDQKVTNDPNDKDAPFQELTRDHLKESYLTTDQLSDASTILSAFDAEIGIPSLPYQKKERLVTSEANMRGFDAKARSKTWIKCLNSSLDNIRKLYPDINLSFSLAYDEGVNDVER